MATRTANAKATAVNPKTGKTFTPEEIKALQEKLGTAWTVFDKRFRGRGPKDRIFFLARVIEMADSPSPNTDNFGVTKMASLVKVELLEAGLEGLRFQAYLTDNPATNTVQNPDSALNHLVRACTGREIPRHGRFDWDTDEVVGQLVMAGIQRGNQKDAVTDGRGAFYSELKDFQRYFPDDEEEGGNDEVADAEVPF